MTETFYFKYIPRYYVGSKKPEMIYISGEGYDRKGVRKRITRAMRDGANTAKLLNSNKLEYKPEPYKNDNT